VDLVDPDPQHWYIDVGTVPVPLFSGTGPGGLAVLQIHEGNVTQK
jgi:hypothetical protein